MAARFTQEQLDKLDKETIIRLFLGLQEQSEELTREDVFLDTKDRIDFMLSLCGFAALDPRSSFDWLILYCMCAEDLLDMDDRMRNMFLQMFGDGSGDS